MNKRNVNAEVLLFSDETWEHLGCISTLRETFGAVTNVWSFIYFFMKLILRRCVQLYTLFPNDNINPDTSQKLTLDQASNTRRRKTRPRFTSCITVLQSIRLIEMEALRCAYNII